MNDLTKRTLSGLAFILVMLAGLLFNEYLFAALMLVMMVGMLHEFFNMAMGRRKIIVRCAAILAGIAQFMLFFATLAWNMPAKYTGIGFILLAGIICLSVLNLERGNTQDYAYILAGIIYIGIPLAFSSFLAFSAGGFDGRLILAFFILIWCSDVGAYCSGSTLGKFIHSKKMSPEISPNKTWVGFWGGLVFCIIGGIVLKLTAFIGFPLVHTLALAAIVHAGGVCGDLFESLWKRHFGVKDSGNVIPGHGGLLDRFDSSLLAIPMGTIYLTLFNLI